MNSPLFPSFWWRGSRLREQGRRLPLRGHTWVGSGIRGLKWTAFPVDRCSQPARPRASATLICSVAEAAVGARPERRDSCCLDLCCDVKLNLLPSVCKQDMMPTQKDSYKCSGMLLMWPAHSFQPKIMLSHGKTALLLTKLLFNWMRVCVHVVLAPN